jgi:hypothetical protein
MGGIVRTSLFFLLLLLAPSSTTYAFDLYAINNWDAIVYAFGAHVMKTMYSDIVYDSVVVIFTFFAILRIFPSLKGLVNDLLKQAGAIFVFSALCLWPSIKTDITIYTATKSDAYTNVLKWIVPVELQEELIFDEYYVIKDVELPLVQSLVFWMLGDIQGYLMTLIDSAGKKFVGDEASIRNGAFMYATKLSTLQAKAEAGLEGIISDLKAMGKWTSEDDYNYKIAQQSIRDFFAYDCVSPSYIQDVFQKNIVEARSDGLVFKFTDAPIAISALADNIDPRLPALKKAKCEDWARTAAENLKDICQKWADEKNEVPEICYGLADVSIWTKVTNTARSTINFVKELPGEAFNFSLDVIKEIVTTVLVSLAGLIATASLAILLVLVPILLGIVNMLITFLSPLAFLTLLIISDFTRAVVRLHLEMLYARMLYVVFILAHTLTSILNAVVWKSIVGLGAGGILGALTSAQGLRILATKLSAKAFLAAGGGVLTLSSIFFTTAISLIVALVVLITGAKVMRTLIIGEGMNLYSAFSLPTSPKFPK